MQKQNNRCATLLLIVSLTLFGCGISGPEIGWLYSEGFQVGQSRENVLLATEALELSQTETDDNHVLVFTGPISPIGDCEIIFTFDNDELSEVKIYKTQADMEDYQDVIGQLKETLGEDYNTFSLDNKGESASWNISRDALVKMIYYNENNCISKRNTLSVWLREK